MTEFAELATASARRKIRRGLSDNEKLFMERVRKGKGKLRTHCRDMVVVPEMLGLTINVYNGKEWKPVEIIPELLGCRLGELALSRKIVKHSSPGVGATRSSASMSVR